MDFLNQESRSEVEKMPNDPECAHAHIPPVDTPDWHLQDWLAHFEKRQASLVNELGWDKSRANFVYHGKQAYKRDLVNEISAWLGIEPYELLMPPADALQLRQLRQAAIAIAANAAPATPQPKTRKKSQNADS
ncbi:hypothetical protein [Brevundimonas naejangsanensis]|uniref:hypothetical protein n=1 Tax=Brevundimonas naejangsanensis TaxID=588932 RepID=UPI0026EC3050|nr:hypothetical protein [Brevundimonas naejangsanensis]